MGPKAPGDGKEIVIPTLTRNSEFWVHMNLPSMLQEDWLKLQEVLRFQIKELGRLVNGEKNDRFENMSGY